MAMAGIIRQALRPLFLVCFFIGVNVYPMRQPESGARRIAYLSTLYSLVIWSLYMYIIYYAVTLFTLNGVFLSTSYCITVTANILATVASAFVNFYHQERFAACMTKIGAVDDTLEKLGTPKMYRKIFTWSKRIIIMWLVYVFLFNTHDTYWYFRRHQQRGIFWALTLAYVLNYTIHINILMDFIFIIFMWYIGNRFDKINDHVQCLLAEKGLEMSVRWNKSVVVICQSANNYKRVLWTSMHIHLELRRIVLELNLMFGVQMTIETTSYLIYLTTGCYYLCRTAMEESSNKISLFELFCAFLWISSFIIRLYVINSICDHVKYKANVIHKRIHHLTTVIRYADVWREMHQFTLQAMYQPLEFTGMGLFKFGHKFIWKFYIKITTFVMLMVQFKVPVLDT